MIMNDEDLRDCFAMFALAGAVMSGRSRTADEVWQIADDMLNARKQKDNDDEEDDSGIASVAPKRTRRKSR